MQATPTPFFKRGFRWRGDSARIWNGYDIEDDVRIGNLYSAAGDSIADVMLDETRRKLTCKGWRVDSILHVSPTVGPVHDGARKVPQV